MVCVPQIYFGVDAGFTWGIQKVSNKRKRVLILFRKFVETAIVNAEAEGSILLFDEKDGHPMRRTGRADETVPQVLIHELAERLLLNRRERVHLTDGRFGTILQFYLEVVRPVFWKYLGLKFAEEVSELMIFLWDA